MTQAASGYERVDGDRYNTPWWCTEALLASEPFDGLSIDPACGGWDIVEAGRRYGILIDGFDIHPDPAPGGQVTGDWATKDFLTWDGWSSFGTQYRNVLTNPPYGKGGRLAVQFIEHALKITEPVGGKVAMLLRIDFDSANGRRRLFGDHPAFAAKYVLTKRIRWVNLPQVASGPTENHCWMIWDWRKRRGTAPVLGYLPLAEAA